MTYVYLTGEHETATCPTCKVEHTLPKSLHDTATARRGQVSICCPHGHKWVYTPQAQLDREDALRQERDLLKQRLAFKDDEIERQRKEKEHERNRRIALKGVLTKTKNRVAAGVCPCCNRTFENLARHMAAQHKGFASEDAEQESSPDEDQVVDKPPEAAAAPPTGSSKERDCSVDNCKMAIFARGLCSKHYQRQRKTEQTATAEEK